MDKLGVEVKNQLTTVVTAFNRKGEEGIKLPLTFIFARSNLTPKICKASHSGLGTIPASTRSPRS